MFSNIVNKKLFQNSTTTSFLRHYSTIKNTTTSPKGFKTGTYACGLKKSGALDICLIHSEKECNVAAVFTENKVKAAPVLLSKSLIEKHKNTGFQSLIINSGGANACTGPEGEKNAQTMSFLSSKLVNAKQQSLVMSTGIIGQQLDMKKVELGITKASENLKDDWLSAAKAIMTTDKVPKLVQKQIEIQGKQVNITGICKGAGMIHPNMATMLCTLCTDADISEEALKSALKHSIDYSFNSINVDGDMSTNDTVAVFSNGLAGNKRIDSTNSKEYLLLEKAMRECATELAQMIVRDAEGATKFISVVVRGAKTEKDGKIIANSIATSSLVKTAMYGEDANWGRVLAAVGYSGADGVVPSNISMWFASGYGDNIGIGQKNDPLIAMQFLKDGQPTPKDDEKAAKLLSNKDISIIVDLNNGNQNYTMWTCDLTVDYVKANSHYRT
ncbi:amino-acid N-acetyltransferase [Dictyostelium discoideum AX4]|uniref:Arginine biosynthesis bifunctional protein ArgJ, mitochondrial n=1 Tax=Dictyostelium discoideum TaxID=44689 RepID=ARGJ_DICDI|nr:amino-acid N-acetyltransferase [Dictyostelium discoideum AX4]Q54DY1.1 RecName: Full=Arginine biosynthesis bifunctional protein ArgJ, mitochondrial; Includes: RecName: Full=Glutamate N-acetyltransferase; Short=GAT; AltName: Full=Ornithine acetyltransferase; Short=OATase; AltName: Full=Ornithine transacetylase; Includes: RecName: Full=Amino-acid acetyltransferase; AltName: Full=N-acetylglutamate synthase; Short=AGS; Contains: RecName: Full=Arginine biosynthesis bifunctional protein ArgJ alpha cha|eukprot:XP_629915.1 amino-acid N-acetyltransferase [Dictyostelium discoideum AX4]